MEMLSMLQVEMATLIDGSSDSKSRDCFQDHYRYFKILGVASSVCESPLQIRQQQQCNS